MFSPTIASRMSLIEKTKQSLEELKIKKLVEIDLIGANVGLNKFLHKSF